MSELWPYAAAGVSSRLEPARMKLKRSGSTGRPAKTSIWVLIPEIQMLRAARVSGYVCNIFVAFRVGVHDIGLDVRHAGLAHFVVGAAEIEQRAVAGIQPIHTGLHAHERNGSREGVGFLGGFHQADSGP